MRLLIPTFPRSLLLAFILLLTQAHAPLLPHPAAFAAPNAVSDWNGMLYFPELGEYIIGWINMAYSGGPARHHYDLPGNIEIRNETCNAVQITRAFSTTQAPRLNGPAAYIALTGIARLGRMGTTTFTKTVTVTIPAMSVAELYPRVTGYQHSYSGTATIGCTLPPAAQTRVGLGPYPRLGTVVASLFIPTGMDVAISIESLPPPPDAACTPSTTCPPGSIVALPSSIGDPIICVPA